MSHTVSESLSLEARHWAGSSTIEVFAAGARPASVCAVRLCWVLCLCLRVVLFGATFGMP